MSLRDFRDAHSACMRMETLICDNVRAAQIVTDLAYDSRADESVLWVLDRLREETNELRETFYRWFELNRIEKGLGRGPG